MSPSAAVANNKTMMIERRKADDMSKPVAEKSPNPAARYGGPVRQRRAPHVAPALDGIDAAQEGRSGGRWFRMGQGTHHEMRGGKTGAGQRGHSQQLKHPRQGEADRQSDQELDIAPAHPAAGIDDEQQRKQDGRANQRFRDMRRAGDLAHDPE